MDHFGEGARVGEVFGWVGGRPVGFGGVCSVEEESGDVTRSDLVYACENRSRVVQPPTVNQTLHIPLRPPTKPQKRLDLGPNKDPPGRRHRPIKRFNPIPIPRDEDPSSWLVIYDDGEFPAEVEEEFFGAIVQIEEEREFRVRGGCEYVAGGFEVPAEGFVVVDFTCPSEPAKTSVKWKCQPGACISQCMWS